MIELLQQYPAMAGFGIGAFWGVSFGIAVGLVL